MKKDEPVTARSVRAVSLHTVGKKVVFVSGPFRPKQMEPFSVWEMERNIREAEEAALEVARRGAVPVCVHSECRFFTGGGLTEEQWIDLDKEKLARCDAILLLQWWASSTGARSESEFARELGLEVFDLSVGAAAAPAVWDALQQWAAEGSAAPAT